jgi:hypothetical protein
LVFCVIKTISQSEIISIRYRLVGVIATFGKQILLPLNCGNPKDGLDVISLSLSVIFKWLLNL